MPATAPLSDLTPRQRRVMLLLGSAAFFHGYDMFIAALALPYIGPDLGADESGLAFALVAVRLGALASIGFGRFSDRHGRRRLLVASVLAYTAATVATAFSRGLIDFALCQMIAAMFITTELALAQVALAEELPPGARGFGQGVLGALDGLGAGAAALLFPIIVSSELGWRGMYLVGALPLLVLARFRRTLPESAHWQRSAASGRRGSVRELLDPRWARRLLVLVIAAASVEAVAAAGFSFASLHLVRNFGWSAAGVSALIIGAGSCGFAGNFVLGRLADRVGRRWVGCLGQLGHAVSILLFYQAGLFVPAFALMTFAIAGAMVSLNALCTELFPTRLRATAKSCTSSSGTLGAVLGLGAVAALSPAAGVAGVLAALAVVSLACAPLILLLPETRGISLDEVEAAAAPECMPAHAAAAIASGQTVESGRDEPTRHALGVDGTAPASVPVP